MLPLKSLKLSVKEALFYIVGTLLIIMRELEFKCEDVILIRPFFPVSMIFAKSKELRKEFIKHTTILCQNKGQVMWHI